MKRLITIICASMFISAAAQSAMPDAGTPAREYYDKAVTGDAAAQHALASCYATAGGGVARDMSASFDWDLKAAQNGDGDAMYAVGCRYAEGIEGVVAQDYGEALRWWRKAAETGDLGGDAHYKIAECYRDGLGVTKDIDVAVQWLLLSAGRGNLRAQTELGVTYMCDGNATEGLKWLKEAARRGEPEAQLTLGKVYEEGICGVPQDYYTAFEWYKKAAEQEWPDGMSRLGMMYLTERGCSADAEKGLRLIKMSAEQGSVEAQLFLAWSHYYIQDVAPVAQDFAEAERWCRRPAEEGTVRAQTLMGHILYQQGRKSEAADWWGRAAKQGDAEAVTTIGKYYLFDLNDYQAIPFFEEAAESGYAEAEYLLGWCYLEGWGVTADKDKARSLLKRAAEQGDEDAQDLLCLVDRDPKQDIEDIYNAAVAGDAAAQHELAVHYATGDHVPRDMAESVKWDKKAAEQGNADAQYALGCRYANGEGGLAKDMGAAVKFWEKAAGKDVLDACCRLGECFAEGNGVPRDGYVAAKFFKMAADKGHSYAQYSLGAMCLLLDQPKNAAMYFKMAAEQGNAEAQFNLAQMYYFGNGVKLSYTEAVKWLEKAAQYEYWPAVYALGNCYIMGQGVSVDSYYGLALIQEAAENGLEAAQVSMGDYLFEGKNVNRDYAKALEWYRKAAAQGNAYSMRRIGMFYENGLGVTHDPEQARSWYQKAADSGNAEAATQRLDESLRTPDVWDDLRRQQPPKAHKELMQKMRDMMRPHLPHPEDL